MALTKKQLSFLRSKLDKKGRNLTEKEKQKIWNEFGDKFGNDIKVSYLEIPLGLIPNFIPNAI